MRRLTAVVAVAALLGMASGAAAIWTYQHRYAVTGPALTSDWVEASWPLAPDQWGTGKFFYCAKERCGADVKLYVRAKIGFCKCDVGVDDDAELDRVGDILLFSEKPGAQAPGHPIAVLWMKGRSRSFDLGRSFLNKATGLSIGYNDHCDAIVATAVTHGGQAAVLEPAVIDLLGSERVMRWAKVMLGL